MKNYTRRAYSLVRQDNGRSYFLPIGAIVLIVILAVSIGSIIASTDQSSKTAEDSTSNKPPITTTDDSVPTESTESAESKPASSAARSYEGPRYAVSRVVDGDTVDLNINGNIQRVRLIGVNTPETVHPNKPQECFGVEASNYLKSLLSGRSVGLETDRSQGEYDKYNRLLGYLWLDDTNVNYQIIYDGYAYEYTYNVPYKYQSDFKMAQMDADMNNRGLWSPDTCNGEK